MSRKIAVLLAGAVILAAAATSAEAYVLEQSDVVSIKSKKWQAAQASTVKGSKSNTSDRMGGGGGKGTAQATTVKSSKSNTSDRMGGGGGKGAASRAKSNTSDRMGGGGGGIGIGGVGGMGIGVPTR